MMNNEGVNPPGSPPPPEQTFNVSLTGLTTARGLWGWGGVGWSCLHIKQAD